MNLLKKIKIELWVLCLLALLSFILAVGNGFLVRQELVGSIKFGIFSKTALFLAEIPKNIKEIVLLSQRSDLNAGTTLENNYKNISGFQGSPLKEEAYLLLSRYDGNKFKSVVELVDLKTFEVKKIWEPDIDLINSLVDKSIPEFRNTERDSHLHRYRIIHPYLTEDGGLIFKNTSPLVKIDKNSQFVWQNQKNIFHHSIEQDYEGNFWIPTRAFPFQVDNKYVGSNIDNYKDDAITKVSSDGEILFEKSVSKILIENNLKHLLFAADGYNKDPIHLNDIQPVMNDSPYWKRGDLFLSMRHLSMIILYRPSTNKIIWQGVGNTMLQHDVNILDDHRISIFNNNAYFSYDNLQIENNNEIIIYDFASDSYSKYLNEPLMQYKLQTVSGGKSDILPNGALFVEEEDYGRMLYFNKDKTLQWQYVNRANNAQVYLLNWSRIFSSPNDLKKIHKILNTDENK